MSDLSLPFYINPVQFRHNFLSDSSSPPPSLISINDSISTSSSTINYPETGIDHSSDDSIPTLVSINDSMSFYSNNSESSIDYDSSFIIQQTPWYPVPLNIIPYQLRLNLSPLFTENSEIQFRKEFYHVFEPDLSEYFIYYLYLKIHNPFPIPSILFHFSPVYFYPEGEP